MDGVIQLLPDNVANQIAAGEVIQRPASVVKELMENAIDAGASSIKLILKDAGRTLIQVVDNGKGMNQVDARLSFERHATSKIKNAKDLFQINTKGFRGEALASIAAIARVELKTKEESAEAGQHIIIEGSKVLEQTLCSCSTGSSFSVKNLFYNVPARRKFLKSDAVETKHVIQEFQRLVLAHPGVEFQMHHNGTEIFHLPNGNYRQRIVNVFGGKTDEKLVPLEEETDFMKVFGFIGKPEYAKRTRGDQYFFINDRFIKNHYLQHAVQNAYDELLPKGSYPFFTLYIEMDPSEIDVNIHPTKTEVKFSDERSIYAIIRSAVRQSLGKFNVSPSLDFEQETGLNIQPLTGDRQVQMPEININPNYNPFETKGSSGGGKSNYSYEAPKVDGWEQLHAIQQLEIQTPTQQGHKNEEDQEGALGKIDIKPVFQVGGRYVVSRIKSGMILIDQQRAHERILFDKHMKSLEKTAGQSQQLLFPETISLNPADHSLIIGFSEDLGLMGFDLEDFGGKDVIVRGIPVVSKDKSAQELIEELLEHLNNSSDKADKLNREDIALAVARTTSIKVGKVLKDEEMNHIIDELFACEIPYYDPKGLPTILTFTTEEITQKFDS